DLALGKVLAVRAEQHDVRRGRVDVLGDRDVVEARLAGATAAAVVERAGVRQAPGPGENVDLVLVRLVDGFALHTVELEKHVHCHECNPSVGKSVDRLFYVCFSRPSPTATATPGSRTRSRPPAGNAAADETSPSSNRGCLRSPRPSLRLRPGASAPSASRPRSPVCRARSP